MQVPQLPPRRASAQSSLGIEENTKYANELLADLLAQAQGEALPYSQTDLAAALANFGNAAVGSSAATASIPGKASAPGVSGASTSREKATADLAKTIVELSSKVDNLGAAVNEQAQQTNNLRGAFDRHGLGYGMLGWGGNGMPRRAYAL